MIDVFEATTELEARFRAALEDCRDRPMFAVAIARHALDPEHHGPLPGESDSANAVKVQASETVQKSVNP